MQTLYTYPKNFRAYKALIAAEYSGAKVTVAPESEFKFGETNQSADFLAKFPLGKVSTIIIILYLPTANVDPLQTIA